MSLSRFTAIDRAYVYGILRQQGYHTWTARNGSDGFILHRLLPQSLQVGFFDRIKTDPFPNLSPLPSNARVEPFIPHADLLPHVDVMVTNGGYNGVQTALKNGVPLVVAGQTEEKPEIAARVEWAQVGINLRTRTPSPKRIREAVKTVLTDSRYRTRSQQFQTEMQSYNAAAIAVTLLEQLAETKQPVLRDRVKSSPLLHADKVIGSQATGLHSNQRG